MGVIQNVWAPYLTMRHVLLESFVWEEANRVPFLIRGVSYDRDLSVRRSWGEHMVHGYSNGLFHKLFSLCTGYPVPYSDADTYSRQKTNE